jgi:hypothetical protein
MEVDVARMLSQLTSPQAVEEALSRGRGVRYAGLFECAGWEVADGDDKAKTAL